MAQADYANDAPPDPTAFSAVPVVALYDPTQPADGPLTDLPDVRVVSVEFFEGARPPEAQLRYVWASGNPLAGPKDPDHVEDVLPVDAAGKTVVNQDERLVVQLGGVLLFDGFAQAPQGDLGEHETGQFLALGTPFREWDSPLAVAVYRDGVDPKLGPDVPTDDVIRFNPEGNPNASPFGYDHFSSARPDDGASKYPVPTFLDWRIRRSGDTVAWPWTLSMAARYILFAPQLTGGDFGEWTNFYLASEYDTILDSRTPTEPGGTIDPSDTDTYVSHPIEVQDLDVTGDPWPVALEKLIKPHGFDFRFDLSEADDGSPEWWLVVYRRDDAAPAKSVAIQAAGDYGAPVPLDPNRTNAHGLRLQRDNRDIVNQFASDTALTRYEVGVILQPGFEIDAIDARADILPLWVDGAELPAADPDKYRVYVADETGDGHWGFTGGAWVTGTPIDFSPILGKPAEDGTPAYANRRRPGEGKLLTRDKQGEKRKAELYVSAVNPGDTPKLWDGTSYTPWQYVSKGGWELLDDRLGVRLTRPDLEDWVISEPQPEGVPFAYPFPSGAVRVVSCLASPGAGGDAATKRFWFLLVTVIEGDRGLEVAALRRSVSPTSFAVTRRLNDRNRFKKEVVDVSSQYYTEDVTDAEAEGLPAPDPAKRGALVLADDTKACQADADAHRKAHEVGTVAGSVTIRRIDLGYRVGDRLTNVVGRTMTLRQNLGTAQGEGSVYPAVVAVRYNLDNQIETVLSLADRRADPPPERRTNPHPERSR